MMSTMQVSLRSKCDDEYSGEESHRFVESKRNQRIEALWSYIRQSHSFWRINLLNDLAQKSLFLSGNYIKSAYDFVYQGLLDTI